MNDKHLKKVFIAHKIDVLDEDFSERIIKQLPERKNILPQIVMVTCILIGLTLTFAIQGIFPVLEQINSLVNSITLMRLPSISSIFTYFATLALIGFIAYSAATADAG